MLRELLGIITPAISDHIVAEYRWERSCLVRRDRMIILPLEESEEKVAGSVLSPCVPYQA